MDDGVRTLMVIDPKQKEKDRESREKVKEEDEKTKNIIIIANNKENIPDIRKIPIKIGLHDIIVRFNKGLYPRGDKTYDNPNNLIVMFRQNAKGYSGIRPDGTIDSERLRFAREYYLVDNTLHPDLIQKIELKNKIKVGILHTKIIKEAYALEKTPSSGFIALIHFMVQYPKDRLILYGFTWEGWSGHNFKKERQIAKQLEAEGRLLIIPS